MEVVAPARLEALADRLDRSVGAMNAAFAEVLGDVARFDERRLWRRDGATCMSGWLAARYGLSRASAVE